MQLDYRHDGKAVVGLMDGHCKYIGPEDAKSLIWTVKVTRPVPAKPPKKTGRKTSKHK